MDLDIIILSKVSQTKTNKIWYGLYAEPKKCDTSKLIYKTETDSQSQRKNLWLPEGKKERKWSCSVVSNSLWPHGLQPTRLLPPWDSPGKSTGVGCHFLLQGIFPTQGSNPGLLHCRQMLYCLSHQGSLPEGKSGGIDWKFGINMYTLLYLK